MQADVAWIGRPHRLVAGEGGDPRQRFAEAGVSQMTDVEFLVRVRLRVFDHDLVGLRCTTSIRGTLAR